MKQECSCSAQFIEAEQNYVNKNVEVDGKKTLKSNNIKSCKLAAQYFLKIVINKDETVIMFLEIHTHL
jgi:hypothetical protein